MIEVKVGIDHHPHIARINPHLGQGILDRIMDRSEQRVEVSVTGSDTGVDQDRTVGMVDHKAKYHAGRTSPRVVVRQGDLAQQHRVDHTRNLSTITEQ